MIEDGGTDRGSVTTVQRVGDTIRRPCGLWTPAVHALLGHLENAGFPGAPRVLGTDGEGREMLTLVHGEVAMRPWPAALRTGPGVEALGGWLRGYHEAVRGFRPVPQARWCAPDAPPWRPGMIVRHGDLGPWNSVWNEGALAGFIDWDFAEPGEAVEDLAQLAWYAVPLRARTVQVAAGFPDGAPLAERLRRLCAAYGGGVTPAAVVDALARLQRREAARIRELGGRGVPPWQGFLERGDAADIEGDGSWLERHREALVAGRPRGADDR